MGRTLSKENGEINISQNDKEKMKNERKTVFKEKWL